MYSLCVKMYALCINMYHAYAVNNLHQDILEISSFVKFASMYLHRLSVSIMYNYITIAY